MAKSKGAKKSYLPVIKKAWCGLGRACTEDIIKSFMGMIVPGGMVETFIKAQFKELKDVDMQLLGPLILEQFVQYCERESAADGAGIDAGEDLDPSGNRQEL